jgi:hypothetical protein
LSAGIAWYRVDNYTAAKYFFDQIAEMKPDAKTKPLIAQALVWKSLTAKKLGNEKESQKWLRVLLDQYSQAEESFWINVRKAKK